MSCSRDALRAPGRKAKPVAASGPPEPEQAPLVICSKSAWTPPIRREHALARLAAAHGHPVSFIERPLDIRALESVDGALAWLRGLAGRPTTLEPDGVAGDAPIGVISQSTLLPGHLNTPSELSSNALLARQLRRAQRGSVLVVNVPWQWPATARFRGRRVFDCADDWRVLAGHRRERIADLYRSIAREADAIVVVEPALLKHFPGARVVVVRNGVGEEMLGPLAPREHARRLVQAGTLTPRFDAPLASRLLELLPEWSLDLYGQCQYPGAREQPGPELAELLSHHAPRARWHGALDRSRLSGAIDRGAVALALNRPELSRGQDSMKLYDYAARGRPIVATPFAGQLSEQGPPHMLVAGEASELAAAVLASREEPDAYARQRRRWAERQRWAERWDAWAGAIFGAGA